jgi:hypothetical protein
MAAPKWLAKILNIGGKELLETAGGLYERISAGHLGKKEFGLELAKLEAQRAAIAAEQITSEIQAKERILVAELQQGDSYTKRARPSIVYVGLIGAIVDAIGTLDFTMSPEFWYVWGGVCGIYVIGRSAEKRGVNGTLGKVVGAITGGKSSLLND